MATSKKLVIEGELVTSVTVEVGENSESTYRRETTGKTIRVDSWLAEILAQRGEQVFAPALSEGRILARKTKGARECVVVEFSPAVRRVIEKVDQSDEHARQVAMPWIYLVVRFYNGSVDTMFVFYRNDRVDSLSAEFCLSNLPNVYGSDKGYKICTGTVSGLKADWSLESKIDWLVRNFWDSLFNKDLLDHHWNPSRKLAGHPQTFAEWEEKSRSDPGFILKIQWRPLGKTIQQVLDEGVKNG
jgi:hypothetical protein